MKFLYNLQLKNSVRAFTLIETLVSIMIISFVILGPLSVAMKASAYARQTKDTIIATYLSQEALELLHHQQDSIFLRCLDQASTTLCPMLDGETPSMAAWRIFQSRLGTNAQGTSCYDTDSNSPCSYDFINMTTNEDSSPSKYPFSSNSCATLSVSPQHLYLCTGVHGATGYTLTPFTRSVSVKTLPTFDANYNNDLRVTVTVSFKRLTGYVRQIKIVDFFHAHA